MRLFLMSLLCGVFMLGCTEKADPVIQEKSEENSSALSAVDNLTDWFLETYSSIEDEFAKAEKDLFESDRSSDLILTELHESIGVFATTAKAKRVELDRINGNLIDLKSQFEQLAIESPFAEREIYENSLREIDTAIDEKVQPMEDFDFPYLAKFNSSLELAVERWKKTLTIMRKSNASDFREKLSELIAKHFEDNLKQQIKERQDKWSSSK